jgi:hypothetical protein
MDLIRRREPTGAFCDHGHPQQIEYHAVVIDGVEVPRGQIGPRCWIAGCPANEAAKAKEQPGAAGLGAG